MFLFSVACEHGDELRDGRLEKLRQVVRRLAEGKTWDQKLLLLVPNARQFKTYPVCPKSAKAVFGAKAGRPRLPEAEKREREAKKMAKKRKREEETSKKAVIVMAMDGMQSLCAQT